ncbi:c-type cytochrome biogenesis protein CcmI [Rhodopseudomonas pseudopalustris]|uniref:Cytochrome c-type biogenesis protein CcmH n=1 Tax=Rhodopseudomonas pseudopalustris TaxID=1513892 RepID=A0A1H8S5U6_9BRAD|nr:c-type cytochrome biogenesis protein CcmI [Rhodopseudomonas pseudopalustris]SEO73764.1 cytochrome c-type biogenesis protein CcmH [Rhodopseudomonas pseudopalustris]
MALWFVFAIMTAIAAFAVLWPLGRGVRTLREGTEANVYKDQLAEVDRDAEAGLIGAPEASAARVEIGRRLLASAEVERPALFTTSRGLRRGVAVFALIGLPALALAVYLPLGSPMQGDDPLAQRTKTAAASQPLENLVAQVEAHLEKNPTDGRGWTVLAPVLFKLSRFEDAARAYRNSINYAGETADRRADLGEVLSMAAGGVITAEAKSEFERAVKLNADDPKARYFLGLAAEQDGRPKDAAAIWRAMLEKAPAEAPWKPMLQAQLARLEGTPLPALPDDTIASAQGMSEGDRNAMIRGMVDKLAARLQQNGDDVEGWLRLVRAYMVLGDADKARSAQAQARQAVAGNAERLKQLNDGLKNLGLDG